MNRETHSIHGSTGHIPWNKHHLIGPKPPLKLREIWAIRIRLQLTHRVRELAFVQPRDRQQAAGLRSRQA